MSLQKTVSFYTNQNGDDLGGSAHEWKGWRRVAVTMTLTDLQPGVEQEHVRVPVANLWACSSVDQV